MRDWPETFVMFANQAGPSLPTTPTNLGVSLAM